ncbi:NAD+ synthase [Thomasclavelia ramosa DSM 1402]|uniref:Glutamine-dependent NAD(+) synthetase n=3 Tax=Coprobacillaceae TaxID=2810280 RepID=B0N3C7_9FIRM|nr:NAD+ synthase [Thomasclavelia ramosa DSM 1402]
MYNIVIGGDIMKDGYIRVAAGSFETSIANVKNNSENICNLINEAYHNDARVLVLPELCLTGYTCEDLFNQDRLLNEAKQQLQTIITATNNKDLITIVGLPYQHLNSLYNVAAVIHQGALLALVPKTHIPNYQEFYEARRFEQAPKENTLTNFNGQKIPFGTHYVFASTTNSDFKFGVEICEDLWLPDAPSTKLALNGANLILNPSASNEITTKSDYRRLLVSSQSARLVCGYVYCNAGNGESTTDVVFSGHHIISENGTMIKESRGFDSELIYGDLDLKKLSSERRKMTTFKSYHNYETIYFDSTNIDLNTTYYYDPHPFVPSNRDLRAKRCKEVFDIQTRGLMQRLKATGIKKVVIGISGGLDSTLALLVCTMAFKKLNYDTKDIIAITMPCFGTTSRTKNNALGLMEELAVTSIEVDITESVRIQFRDIEQDENIHDVTYENVQARTRTEILMNKANQVGGLVIGTGDLSEVALGWSTYNGDHMSMYAVNVSVPKTLVRYLVDYIASLYHGEKLETILKDILDTPVSPELLPQENDQIVQKTEDIVGPYELHDFFIYHMVRFGDEPRKLYRKTKLAFKDKYDKKTIKKWLTKFYWRFFSQQFKRSCIPDGPKVGSVSLSPRGDWRMPSDANVSNWIDEIEKI